MSIIEDINQRRVPSGSVGVWWLGQASLVLKLGETVMWVDPYLDPAERRLMPPLCRPEDVTNAGVVLLTHDHIDHIDPATLPALAAASPDAQFVAPRAHEERVRSLVGERAALAPVDDSDTVRVGDLEITAVPAAHEEIEIVPGKGHAFLGYIVRGNGVSVYVAGDTTIWDGMVERLAPENIDLAFLPINGRDAFRTAAGTIGNMSYIEAAELAERCGFETVVPVHWGMFAGNTVPPGHFVSYAAERGYAFEMHLPALGKPWLYAKVTA
jgi:L-ascorbate metabolism protein UlaG (beta-lactamase superfamily)